MSCSRYIYVLGILVLAPFGFAPEASGQDGIARSDGPHSLAAAPLSEGITIDGRLDEDAWEEAEATGHFVQQRPNPGRPESERTTVRVLYDERNLYVGMRMYDDDPDRIAAQLGRRGSTNLYSDWAHVMIDSYRDRRSAFGFSVSPAGVKRDAFHHGDDQEDDGWEGVWEVATAIDSLGWTAEFRIPLSQLRFSAEEDEELRWGINFVRDVARKDERTHWAPVPPEAAGFVSLFGTLSGLRDLPSPRRLELRPYVLTRAEWSPGDAEDPFREAGDPGMSMGLDLTYGLAPNLTVTAALNPDFGQVEVDPAVVNLSAFETFFPERRPFFLEGADIFRFPLMYGGGSESLFYTRRIGRAPQSTVPEEATYSDIPTSGRILGAAKLSGQVGQGWSLGVLSAVTARQSARWMDPDGAAHETLVQPLTSYGVARLSRDFREGRTSFGGMATTVQRDLSTERLEFLTEQAYAGGLDLRHRFGGGAWEATGWVGGSHVRGSTEAVGRLQRRPGRYFQRPDADHLSFDPGRTTLSGAAGQIALENRSGNWGGVAFVGARSPGFDVNDAGFQQGADEISALVSINRLSFEPGRHVRNWRLLGNLLGDWTWGGENTNRAGSVFGSLTMLNGWGGHVQAQRSLSSLDPVATRGGPALHRSGRTTVRGGIHSDRRRPVSVDLNLSGHSDDQARMARISPSIDFRPAPRLQASVGPSWTRNLDAAQFVGHGAQGDAPHYFFGDIAQTTLSVDTRLNVSFTPELSLELFAQPFVSRGSYSDFHSVAEPRARSFEERFHTFDREVDLRVMDEVDGRAIYGVFPAGQGEDPAHTFADPGFHVRSLRGNAVLRWEYRPGSTLYLAWQQGRSDTRPAGQSLDLREEVGSVFDAPGEHALMLKASYWFGG